jgi:hypothetical protein
MPHFHRALLVAALLLPSAGPSSAQSAADPSGHWEGIIEMPGTTVAFQVDLATNGGGGFVGSITIPDARIDGLPLTAIAVEGASVVLGARSDQLLDGTLSPDGRSLSGSYKADSYAIPFSASRTGDARVQPRPKSAAIDEALGGTWHGTVEANGLRLRTILTLKNQPDGTSTGSIVSVDEGGMEVPVAITRTGARVTLDAKATGGSFVGELNAAGTELTGTYSKGAVALPLVYRRAGAGEKKQP